MWVVYRTRVDGEYSRLLSNESSSILCELEV